MNRTVNGRGGLRRLGALICAGALLGGLTLWAGAAETVDVNLRPDVTICIDGVEREFYNAGGQAVYPIQRQGTTYLPVRAIGELMGKNVDWNQNTLTVTLSGRRTAAPVKGTPNPDARHEVVEAELRPDFTVVVDGTVRTFANEQGTTVYPLLYNGSTYLPVRAIGELMGKRASWDSRTRTVALDGRNEVTDADTFSGTGTKPPAASPSPASAGQALTLDEAKLAALNNAGLTTNQVTWTKHKLDWENGRQVYELEFCTSTGVAYSYELDAATGAVLEKDYDTGRSGTRGGTVIGDARAREIALSQVPGASDPHIIKVELDRDDGEYEVEIRYQTREYDLEIDAVTGAILQYEEEPIR